MVDRTETDHRADALLLADQGDVAQAQVSALLYIGDQLAKLASTVGSEPTAMGTRSPAFMRTKGAK